MFKTIVVALDGSEGSQRAVPFAVGLARRDNARIVIAHVEEDIVGKGGGPIHATEDEIQADIRRQAEELSGQGVEASVEMASVMVGGPAHAIASIADKCGADLIVTGTRGHSPVAGLLLGSVTQRLLHIAHQPVLVIPDAAARSNAAGAAKMPEAAVSS
jgi:nucleotide-binding universal stress UspA family protein